MTVYLLDPNMALETLYGEMADTRGRLLARTLTAALAAPYDAFLTTWKVVYATERDLEQAQLSATALIRFADADLDVFVGQLDHALLAKTGNNRLDPLYIQFFGTQTPSDLKVPVLGDQLATMQTWVPWLMSSTDTTLAALGATLQTLVKAAGAAVASSALADGNMKAFRASGDRAALFDKANALRKTTDGALSTMPHDPANADLNLPSTFASLFFRPAPRKPKNPRFADIDGEIQRLQLKVTSLQALKAQVQKELDDAAKAKSDADAAEQALANEKQKALESKATAKTASANAKLKKTAAKKLARKAKAAKAGKT